MLIINLRKIMTQLQVARKTKVTISEVAESTGIHRKILSRIYNYPASSVKGETIDLLTQYFFNQFIRCELARKNRISPELLMKKVVVELLLVYPDHDSFLKDIISCDDAPTLKSQGPLAGRIRCQIANGLWEKFNGLGLPEINARLTELTAGTKQRRPQSRKRKIKNRRAVSSKKLFG